LRGLNDVQAGFSGDGARQQERATAPDVAVAPRPFEEIVMRLRTLTILAAAALLAGTPAIAVAKSAKSLAPGQQAHGVGGPGASGSAPGHRKKLAGKKSAKTFAPGYRKKVGTTGSGRRY
jgi:hypothetical protein